MKLTFYHLIINSFFTSNNDVELIRRGLKAFRGWFYTSISIQHMEKPITCVPNYTKVLRQYPEDNLNMILQISIFLA